MMRSRSDDIDLNYSGGFWCPWL